MSPLTTKTWIKGNCNEIGASNTDLGTSKFYPRPISNSLPEKKKKPTKDFMHLFHNERYENVWEHVCVHFAHACVFALSFLSILRCNPDWADAEKARVGKREGTRERKKAPRRR